MRLKNKFRDQDDTLNKFKGLWEIFKQFRYLNGHFVNLGTEMTHPNKFRDR